MANDKLLEGNREFVENISNELDNRLVKLTVEGQEPTTLFIGCCDSRVVPNIITNTCIGELFVSRNIGNFVAPFASSDEFHAGAAAIEYAVSALEVTNIIVCGHSHCGAIASVYKVDKLDDLAFKNTKRWLSLGEKAKDIVKKTIKDDVTEREKLEMTEKLSTVLQLDNLMTYPKVKERVQNGELELNAWYYDIETGIASHYDATVGEFISE
jgi:carbonic anhydrase